MEFGILAFTLDGLGGVIAFISWALTDLECRLVRRINGYTLVVLFCIVITDSSRVPLHH
jgi:hypothetical protein